MPFAISGGVRIYYRVEGAEGKPPLVLVHALGLDHGLWDPQMPALLRRFRVLRVDLRGHGASDAPAGDYAIEQLARDVLAAADAAGFGRFAYCGLSLGGMIGQWLGANAGDRVEKLVLANTSARVGSPEMFETRRRTVLEAGMGAVEQAAMERYFSPRGRASGDPMVASVRAMVLATNPTGYAGCCAAIRDMDQRESIKGIEKPVLVIGGEQDISTPWQGHGDLIASSIPGAKTAMLDAGHLSNVERPAGFLRALFDFLLPASAGDPLDAGLAMRRSVLGNAHVDRAVERTTEFTRAFQDLITRYAWGAVWTRPGLDARTRRLMVLAITASLGRWEEFRLHVRTGLAAELERCELEEVLLQVAVYAGVPAANSGFAAAREEMDKGQG